MNKSALFAAIAALGPSTMEVERSASKLCLRLLGDPVLKMRAERVPDGPAGPDVRELVSVMKRVLQEQNGLGLAAQQVGSTMRVVIMRLGAEIVTALNLEIVQRSPSLMISLQEGCLSVQKNGVIFRTSKRRHQWVRIRFQTLEGSTEERRLEGLDAILAQHEFDHLEGLCIVDGLPRQQRRAAERLVAGQ